jgi:hypothetical protein
LVPNAVGGRDQPTSLYSTTSAPLAAQYAQIFCVGNIAIRSGRSGSALGQGQAEVMAQGYHNATPQITASRDETPFWWLPDLQSEGQSP